MSLQSFICLEFALLVFGMTCLGPMLSAIDMLSFGPLPPLRNLGRSDSLLLAYGCARLGSLLLALDSIKIGSA
eukprot:1944481-Amphidinium_carterae.1